MPLRKADRDEVKNVARQLLERLHKWLALNWRQKIQSRAQVRLAIEDALIAMRPSGTERSTITRRYCTSNGHS
jgi:type I restriction enzyme, R subunit